jgi:HSP20 family molecular chaperone IbpA
MSDVDTMHEDYGKPPQLTFKAFNPLVKQLRTDKGFRVELDVDESQYEIIKELPKFQDKVLEVTIEL